jgi:trehalose 6-phosphate phosphatase
MTPPDAASPPERSAPQLPPYDGRWALFLDIDGTLVDHAATPDAVHVDPRVVEFLERLRDRNEGALALVSGRAIGDIDRLFHPHVFAASGQHGVERRDAAGRLHVHAVGGQALRFAAERVAALTAKHPGLVFEDKGQNLALHYRLAPEMEGEVKALFDALAHDLGASFELQSGKMVCELKPSGLDKGTAIAEFMREPPFAGRTPVFIGDDLTDEHGIAMVNRLGGHSIKVGPGASEARWRVPDAESVRVWLAGLAR